MKESNVKVSVICNAYNHEPYIKDALESFVSQKTEFPFEVLVHDDASTDHTADVICQYEKKYPALIKPIYQTVNQYSQGINITNRFHLPRLRGQYVALCEGDDYWTDPYKLQKQYEAMEAHPEVDMCAHAGAQIRVSSGVRLPDIAPAQKETIFSTREVIAGGGGFVVTNSLFFRRVLLDVQPAFRMYLPLDYALQIQGSLRGGMLYLPDAMSVYRVSVPGSWTVRMRQRSYAKEQNNKIKTMLDMVNEETGGRYVDVIEESKLKIDFNQLCIMGEFSEVRKGKFRPIYDSLPTSWKLKTYIKQFFPWLVPLYRMVR